MVDAPAMRGEVLQGSEDIIKKLRTHRIWKQREASASPQARARRQVDLVLSGLGRSRAHGGGDPESDDDEEGNVSSVAAAAAVGSARMAAAAALMTDGSDSDNSGGEGGAAEAGASRLAASRRSLIDAAAVIASVRKHRLWRTRDSSASPDGKARRQVGEGARFTARSLRIARSRG